MRANEFLELYRQLEESLEEKYSGKKKRYSSVVFEYLNDEESIPFRDEINVCREIRNLLTHNPKLGGEEIVEPAQSVCNALVEAIEYIKKPPLALEFATDDANIVYAGVNQTVLKIMGIMEKSGFSHVPIQENGKFIGVFSVRTIFSYILGNYGNPITKLTTIAELGRLLPLPMHTENYVFAPKTLTCAGARKLFQKIRGKNMRVAVIFITETGSQQERLLGMLAPSDILVDQSFMRKVE